MTTDEVLLGVGLIVALAVVQLIIGVLFMAISATVTPASLRPR